jgi:hypothetical protein
MKKTMLAASAVLALGATIAAVLPASAATVGASVQLLPTGGYIGDLPGSHSYLGDDPITAGTSRSYTVACGNAGSVNEDLTLAATAGFPWNHTAPQAPTSWVYADPESLANVAPGGSLTSTVTVTVPAGTAPGLYVGIVYCNALASTQGGGINEGAGAGIREYVQVP